MNSKSHKIKFITHLARNLVWGTLLIVFSLGVGMVGYHVFEEMSWVDSFVNAAMILSGMGPLSVLSTSTGKIFAGCYALFSGLVFIVLVGILFSPFIHQIFRKIHLEDSKR